MRNILFSKKEFKEESQLTKERAIPDNAVEITQSGSIIHRLIPEFFVTAAFIASVFLSGISLIKSCDKPTPRTDFKFAVEAISVAFICFMVLPYVHEIIHALIYPAKAIKTIWKTSSTYFVYCEAVLMLAMPLVILGFLPFVLWVIFIKSLSTELTYILLIADIYMIFTCLSDIGAIWITLRFVPKDAKVFSYGAHYYYRENEEE